MQKTRYSEEQIPLAVKQSGPCKVGIWTRWCQISRSAAASYWWEAR